MNWMYANSLLAAARDLARHPEARLDPSEEYGICAQYGIFMDEMTDDEHAELERLVSHYMEVDWHD